MTMFVYGLDVDVQKVQLVVALARFGEIKTVPSLPPD
jgi:hypothetical protein